MSAAMGVINQGRPGGNGAMVVVRGRTATNNFQCTEDTPLIHRRYTADKTADASIDSTLMQMTWILNDYEMIH